MHLSCETQMTQCAMMMEKLTRWDTSGRRRTWARSAPAPALEDSRYARNVAVTFSVARHFCYKRVFLHPLIRAGDVKTVANQVPILTPAYCSLLDTETTDYTNWWLDKVVAKTVSCVQLPLILTPPCCLNLFLSEYPLPNRVSATGPAGWCPPEPSGVKWTNDWCLLCSLTALFHPRTKAVRKHSIRHITDTYSRSPTTILCDHCWSQVCAWSHLP